MFILEGVPISPGYAQGKAVVYDVELGARLETPSKSLLPEEVPQEWERLEAALEQSRMELLQLGDVIAGSPLLKQSAGILAAHASMTIEIAELVKQYVGKQLVNVEDAIGNVVDEWIERLQRIDCEYLREREQDVRDVGRRMNRYLSGSLSWNKGPLPPGAIIVARELLPSEVVELAHCDIAGIITERGGRFSHFAILAKAYGIPTVTRVLHATSRIRSGTDLLIDAETGVVTVAPTVEELASFGASQRSHQVALGEEPDWETSECKTSDGVEILLRGNIGVPEDVAAISASKLMGVGLFRTEFLFMEAQTRPDTRSQFETYSEVANALQDCSIVIRTFDLGGDKLPPFLLQEEAHSSSCLRRRGLQFSLLERQLMESQLCAILKVAQTSDISVLFPMVLGSDDLSQAVAMVDRVLDQFGFINAPPLGAMIETPAALFALDEILDIADFIAIGTNDLTQQLLVAGNDGGDMDDSCSATHPAVLRAIEKVIKAAVKHQCPVYVCGEEAARPELAILLIGLGIRELSVSPSNALQVRQTIRSIDLKEATELANRALKCHRQDEVECLLRKFVS
ncbi:phosphoenolpyruvate--protein phosphotransferase [Aeoliella mucimassa]|uniref:Phosphoenolpyruvate-protein phosphotransferase n=1 Tax=Aeoliella mucimassa TaxID=2527972 RepID=A0A518ATE0_9BACT|nr:phosphoenolpyruvate--protein phosphotransferase [Aeoliella mucimassa]QDU58000.1 Phosphoenolpyruvate-protein phosphotransferase [Aeoliella mucimassa]